MEPWKGNRKKLLGLLEEKGYANLLLTTRANIIYATGMRDPTGYLLLSRDCGDILLTPLLDYHRALSQAPRELEVYAFLRGGENGVDADIPRNRLLRGSLAEVLSRLLEKCGGRTSTDAGASSHQIARILLDELKIDNIAGDIMRIRAVKSDEELELISKAVRIAEEAFAQALKLLEEGVSEAEIAGSIYREILARGGWETAFPTIVAFYANSAYPHHTPKTEKLTVEGPVLIDWGAVYMGYRSDTTRTFWWGVKTPSQFQKHLESVLDAVNAAYDVLGPGVLAGDVDNAARLALKKEGLGKYFIHGLGHGVGIEVHEEPYLRPASKTVLEPGMVVTIEPGIYLPGLYGIRIEDLVTVTKTGYKTLTSLPHLLPA
ncbi:MAG: Xaa-Pro peptidase family protein [Desulfurococcales archaeon]|nr:Xaa-Pro peptidase family protein [Desulfurococcales archaeon]